MTEDQKHDAEAAVSDYLELRDEALATPEADDAERAQSAREIVAIVLKFSALHAGWQNEANASHHLHEKHRSAK